MEPKAGEQLCPGESTCERSWERESARSTAEDAGNTVSCWTSYLRSLVRWLNFSLSLSWLTQRRSLFLQLDLGWVQFLNDCWPSWKAIAERCMQRESSRRRCRRESWVVCLESVVGGGRRRVSLKTLLCLLEPPLNKTKIKPKSKRQIGGKVKFSYLRN